MASAPAKGSIVPKCPHCGGRLEPKSNGNGSVSDRCTSCGRSPDAAPSAAPRSRVDVVVANAPCQVKDCPGTLDGSGRCPCCVKRAAFRAAHEPTVICQVCDGVIRRASMNTKYCKACKPIAYRVKIIAKKK